MAKEPKWEQIGLPSMANMHNVLAKSHTSHQLAFIGSGLTINHICLHSLPSR